MRGYGQRVLLERGHPFEIEIAAVKFFDIVAAGRKPKWDRLLIVGRVHRDEGVLRALVSGKQEQPEALVSVPMVEEEQRPASNMTASGADAKELSDQRDGRAPGAIIKVIPAKRTKQ